MRAMMFSSLCAFLIPALAHGAALDGLASAGDISTPGVPQSPGPPTGGVKKSPTAIRKSGCGVPGVTVYSSEAKAAALACAGFARAARFMEKEGWPLAKPLIIRIAARFPERYYQALNADGSPKYDLDNVYGFYESDTAEVFMQTYAQFSKLPADRMIMGMRPSPELYASYVSHEVSHHIAILAYRGSGAIPRVQTEFVSYTVQMETMAPAVREEALRRFRAEGKEPLDSSERIDELYYSLDPQGFTLKSWLFFRSPAGAGILNSIMNGRLAAPKGAAGQKSP